MVQHVRPKYACTACRGNVVIAERLPEPIEKGRPGPGLLAYVITSKYADHLPLYRLEGIFRRQGLELPRKTMCDWMAVCAELLEPIYKRMHQQVLQSKVIGTDDTTVPVLDPTLGKTRTGRLWLYRGDDEHPGLVFDYTPDRSAEGPERMLAGYEGYLQADAYSGYDRLFADGTIIEVGCWMHARRKFHEARTSDPERSHIALAYIKQLYKIEDKGEALDDAGRVALRQAESAPILETFEGLAERPASGVTAQEPAGRGDRICVESLGGAEAVPGGGLPADGQQRGGERGAAGGTGSEELAVRRQRPRGPDGGRADQPGGDLQGPGRGPVCVPAGCPGSDQHAPIQSARRAVAGSVAETAGFGGRERPGAVIAGDDACG